MKNERRESIIDGIVCVSRWPRWSGYRISEYGPIWQDPVLLVDLGDHFRRLPTKFSATRKNTYTGMRDMKSS